MVVATPLSWFICNLFGGTKSQPTNYRDEKVVTIHLGVKQSIFCPVPARHPSVPSLKAKKMAKGLKF